MNKDNNIKTGLRCEVYRAKGYEDCSYDGISSRCDTVTLIGDGVDGPFEPDAKAPAVRLIRRDIDGIYVHAEPDLTHPSNAYELERIGHYNPWFMAGGCLLYSHDSRFRKAVGHSYAISLHDRVERDYSYG